MFQIPAKPAAFMMFPLVLVALASSGSATTARQAPGGGAGTADAEIKAALMSEGAVRYGECAECHQDGGVGPTFAGDTSLASKDVVVKQLLQGSAKGDMPAFAKDLTDRQIAALATYIRNSFENAYGVVLEADVKRLREETKAPAGPTPPPTGKL